MGYTYKQGQDYSHWVRSYGKKNWFSVVGLLLLGLVAVGISLAAPLPLQIIIDSIFGESKLPAFISNLHLSPILVLFGLIIVYGAIHLTGEFFGLLISYVRIKANQRIDSAAMDEEFSAVTRIPYNDQVRGNPMDNIYQITIQSQALSSYVLDNLSSIVQSALTLFGTLTVLYFINPLLPVVVVVSLPFLSIVTIKFGKRIEDRSAETEISHGAVYTFVSESLEKLRTIQAFAYTTKRLGLLMILVKIRNKNATRQLLTTEAYAILTNGIIIIAMTVALAIGSLSVQSGAMTLGFLVVALSYIETAFGQVSVIAEVIGSINTQKATIKQAYEPIERAKLFDPRGQSSPITGAIEFRDVTLKKGLKDVLKNINVIIPAGSIVGIVGPSGGGKTTFIDSILRFNDAHSGQVLIDNVNVHDYNVDWLRSHIALVEQEPDLFETSINENIALADPNRQFDLLDIMAAGSVAELTEYLKEKNQEGDEMIDNNKLSGGQKQRIAIARAFYKRSPIIIMDEPTSALDPSVGHKVVDNIIASANQHTVLMITHDLSLLQKLPSILVIGDGTVQDIRALGGAEEYFRQHADLLK